MTQIAIELGKNYTFRQLPDADFKGQYLAWSIFKGAYLHRADFTGADLRNTDFSGADLREAVFIEADITGAIFDGADLTGASLPEVVDNRPLKMFRVYVSRKEEDWIDVLAADEEDAQEKIDDDYPFDDGWEVDHVMEQS